MAYFQIEEQAQGHVRFDALSWGYRMYQRVGADGLAAIGRMVKAVFGVAALIAALSLWLVPGSDLTLDMLATKGAVSAALVMCAAVLWRGSRVIVEPEVHVDLIRSEVRLVDRVGKREVLRRIFRFCELGAMFVEDHALHIYTVEGTKLAVLDLDPAAEAKFPA